MNKAQTYPWYKEFFPWLVIAVLGLGVTAILLMVTIAVNNADVSVVDQYYKDGLGLHNQDAESRLAQRLGISANMQVADGVVTVALTGAKRYRSLQVFFYHPLDSKLDQVISLMASAGHSYVGAIPRTLPPGVAKMYIDIKGQHDDGQWQLKKVMHKVSDGKGFVVVP